jgi:hypothetical protein
MSGSVFLLYKLRLIRDNNLHMAKFEQPIIAQNETPEAAAQRLAGDLKLVPKVESNSDVALPDERDLVLNSSEKVARGVTKEIRSEGSFIVYSVPLFPESPEYQEYAALQHIIDELKNVCTVMSNIFPGRKSEMEAFLSKCSPDEVALHKTEYLDIIRAHKHFIDSLMNLAEKLDVFDEDKSNHPELLEDLYKRDVIERFSYLPENENSENTLFDFKGRKIVVAKVNGGHLPFYCSFEGTSGKKAGKWYPFFGFSGTSEEDLWFIKGSIEEGKSADEQIQEMENGYNSIEIQEVLKELNTKLVGITDFNKLLQKVDDKDDALFINKINQLMGDPLPSEMDRLFPQERMLAIIAKMNLTPSESEEKKVEHARDDDTDLELIARVERFLLEEKDTDSFSLEIGSNTKVIRTNGILEKNWVIDNVSEDGDSVLVATTDGRMRKTIPKRSLLAMNLVPEDFVWGNAKKEDYVVYKKQDDSFDEGEVIDGPTEIDGKLFVTVRCMYDDHEERIPVSQAIVVVVE